MLIISHIKRFFRLFVWVFAQGKGLLVCLISFSFLGGALEGLGMSSVVPLFALLGNNQETGNDPISQLMRSIFNVLHIDLKLKTLVFFICLVFLLKAIAVFSAQYMTTALTTNFEFNTRKKLFLGLVSSNWSFLSNQKIGHLEQILTTDTNSSSNLILHFGALIPILANIVVYTIVTTSISPVIALTTLCVGVLVFFIFKPIFYKNRVYSKELSDLYKTVSHFINENVLGIKVIKTMRLENEIYKVGQEYFSKFRMLNKKMMLLRAGTNVLMQPIGLIYVFALLLFSYKFGTFTLAHFAIIVYAINKVFVQIQAAQNLMHYIISEEPFLNVIENYQRRLSETKERNLGDLKFNFSKQIQMNGVGFDYDRGRVLDGLNLTLNKGEMVGLIGPSGSGKTTVVDLLLRLYKPGQGTILVDGKDIGLYDLWQWRLNVGYVTQDMFLINDTIEKNIRFYNEGITTKEMVDAAKQAKIYDLIDEMPQKFQTVVGERGNKLSGGQKQRVLLARILARKPSILILDEATSALDNETEQYIQDIINNLRGKITVLIVAHRLSSITNCDRVLALYDGKIIEDGSPDKLLSQKDSYFYKMSNL